MAEGPDLIPDDPPDQDYETLYVWDPDSPNDYRKATTDEIGETARAVGLDLLQNLMVNECTPIPVVIYAENEPGHVIQVKADLHSRFNCDPVFHPHEGTMVYLDTKHPLYLLGVGPVERADGD